MSLKKYTEKRSIKTPEPKAKIYHRKEAALQFVVQKHDASHLHYDFRLEVDGVLKSWAVPKGPSMDPKVKRLAMMVEDHPFDYRTFEGVIPQGYGAGTVMVWDYGTYHTVEEDPSQTEKLMRQGLKEGHFHFILDGEKLKGEFILVRMNRGKENEWLLMKKKDDFSTSDDVLELDRSAISGKTIEEIAQKNGFQPKAIKKPKTSTKPKAVTPQNASKMPHSVKPMLATLTDKPFDDSDWIFEIKLDGFRALAEVNGTHVELYSRNQISFASRFPRIMEGLKQLRINAVLDGEIVGLDNKGVSHFQMLQNIEENAPNTYYYVFDILYLDGKDLRNLSLIERKAILKSLLRRSSSIRYLDHIESTGKEFYALCEQKGLEGIIAKKKNSQYHPGERSKEWLKIKIQMRQEVIICGYTEPKKSRKNFGALVVGVHEGKGLQYVAHVGGGFDSQQLKDIKQMLDKDVVAKSPFKNPPKTNTPVTWVKPKHICEVEFKEWTNEGIMRQPIFIGLRSDKPAARITKEKKVPLKEIKLEKRTKNEFSEEKKVPIKEIKRTQSTMKKSSKGLLDKYNFITHPEKLFWESEGITKGDVLQYYESVSKYILPYLKDRPEVLKRYPNGISHSSFYQKNLVSHPDWIQTVPIVHQDRTVEYLIISDVQSLLYAANLGCIEIHTWFSRYQKMDYPDFMIFDLDPEGIGFDSVIETALILHELLDKLKVPNFCKTSGATGLHIGVPLGALYTFEQAKNLALVIANLTHQKLPKITSLERSPKDRQKKVYIDCLQNNFGQSLAVPFSLRAKAGAPVSMSLEWSEVKRGIRPEDYNILNALEHIKSKKDPFSAVLKRGVNLKSILSSIKTL